MSIISILCFKASYKLFRWLFIFSTILSSLNGVSTLNLPQFTIKSKVIELLDEEGGTSDFTMKLFTISALVILGGSNFTHNNSITDDMDDECDDVRELFSIWGNGSGTVNKKIRTRRASTTDIAEGLSRSASFVADDLMDDSNKKKKGLDNENIVDKNITKNINTTNDNIATNIIPAPFIIVPGQASEYMHQAHNDDSIHHSTEYDESILSSLTTSHFSPTNSTQSNSSQNEYVMTYAQQRINITYNAIAQHITSHTQEKITLYEKSCREYEMLLEILETLNSVGDKHSLSKKLENSIEDIGDCDNEENAEDVIGEGVEVDKKEDKVMAVDNNNLNPFKSKKSEAESSDSELIKKKDVKKKKKKTPDNNNCSDKEIIKKSPKKWHKKVIKTKDVEIEENSNGNDKDKKRKYDEMIFKEPNCNNKGRSSSPGWAWDEEDFAN
ncbi:13283_t:CDS:2 [Entrophospora sp. SA101]|nr:13283_t:CDS:2 [Entrophospora sp. SA101]